ncbi:hypothetical protein AX14_010241 [Amanita brunnescens Koide BX004]|nr:hypothetical protein AX14_010241 [Amanita brunnescens Koide BX004]
MSDPAAQQSQQPRQRKSLYENVPSIKILMPPKGRFSLNSDEWCFTFCSQTVSGRIHGKEPQCRSFCIRKVFPHEVRNVISVKRHRNVGPDGKAKYPLPYEGQPENIPKLLGGNEITGKRRPEDTKYWDEGWYMWTGSGRWAMLEKTETMLLDLEQQQRLEALKDRKRQAVAETPSETNKQTDGQPGARRRKWGYVVPRNPHLDLGLQSLLLPIPPDIPPFWDRINKLLKPTFRALSILRGSVISGEQKQFALRVWDKAWTDEPFILASRTFTSVYERWKENEDERKKDST